ncbi:hypothetical protein BCS93_15380 [Vibrio breoganii]|uniref:Uncharacterized protein n=1 Tax=Vibrio breoganii TaxID=553239 RepID=A0AAP8MUW1_9VIBR|nr:hypothetical protein [Vibrio breoganii]PMP07672.1 hypothetical protein BCS93_15380 [Vibrio breoganii]
MKKLKLKIKAISYQLSAISYQLSAISYQLSAISYQASHYARVKATITSCSKTPENRHARSVFWASTLVGHLNQPTSADIF